MALPLDTIFELSRVSFVHPVGAKLDRDFEASSTVKITVSLVHGVTINGSLWSPISNVKWGTIKQ